MMRSAAAFPPDRDAAESVCHCKAGGMTLVTTNTLKQLIHIRKESKNYGIFKFQTYYMVKIHSDRA